MRTTTTTTTTIATSALVATAAAVLAAITAAPAVARPEPAPEPAPAVVSVARTDAGMCTLERIGTQFVRCDDLTGAGVAAPSHIPEQR
ncbi:hypothetical protein [Agromyces kandeliae]|uniref:Uncharacterized protein n=1 Tax=Agromyces kandeliae TaxID=2666141 RepID=A0A6L5R4B8_9MICO|nr:hypothetical protein [Agromyces kandeliae]MRX44926.1 hypothetical protein [Agromyces kandeliae]